jgi:hypothetical protein
MHSSLDGVSIPPSEWLGHNFIIGLDLEKMSSSPGSGMSVFSGLSTRAAGDTIRFAFDNVNPRINRKGAGEVLDAYAVPTMQFTTLHMDLILELRAEGCILLD